MKNFKNELKAVLVIVLMALLFAPVTIWAKDVKRADKELKDTVIRGNSYKLMLGSKGGRYYLKTSAKGNQYKVYVKK